MSKILLLGGTGAMGVYLSAMLAEKGHDVYVSSRSPRTSSGNVRYLIGNGHDLRFVRKALQSICPDAVVDFMAYTTKEFAEQRDILLSGTGHFLFMSSYRVFADSSLITERSPRLLDVCSNAEYLKTDEYALAKARQENQLRDSRTSNWTILRPSITYSKSRFQFGCLEADTVCFRSLQGLPVVMPLQMLEKRTTMTWGRDVAMLISRLVQNDKALGEDFNVVTSESHTWGEIANIYAKCIDMKVEEVSLEDYSRLCNPYQVKYDRMFDRVLDNRKVLSVTGTRQDEFAELPTALPQELESFKAHPVYRTCNVVQNALMDRWCGMRINRTNLSAREKILYFRNLYPLFGHAVLLAALPIRVLRKLK